MERLFDNENGLFGKLPESVKSEFPHYVGRALRVGQIVAFRKPIWEYDYNTKKQHIAREVLIKGEVVKLPKKQTPRSFVHIRVGNKIEKITLNTFFFGDAHSMNGLHGTNDASKYCDACGLCCKNIVVLQYLGLKVKNGACIHLASDNRCSIYETRPDFCRVPYWGELQRNRCKLLKQKHAQSLNGSNSNEEDFISEINISGKLSKKAIIESAKKHGIDASETQIKELYEVAVMRSLQMLLSNNAYENYHFSIEVYNKQVNFAHRTSNSVMLQQYSTPLPLSYLAGAYVAHEQSEKAQYFEPSAGNGLLTVALDSKSVIVNEIDKNRRTNLQQFHHFAQVLNQDASKPFSDLNRSFDGVITNPPFGRWDAEVIGGYKISKLEHIMSIRALDTMKDNGRAAIIIGGHTEWDKYGRVENGANRYFISYLHHYYQVEDIINIDGKMYGKQGTTFPIRFILINGRKSKPEGTAPLKNDNDYTVRSFDELWERMSPYFWIQNKNKALRLAKARAKALLILMESDNAK